MLLKEIRVSWERIRECLLDMIRNWFKSAICCSFSLSAVSLSAVRLSVFGLSLLGPTAVLAENEAPVASATTNTNTAKEITLATLPNYPPFCFLKTDSPASIQERIEPGGDSAHLQGYSWDIVRDSLHQQGYTLLLNIRPWSRALKAVEAGSIDVLFPAGFNEKRSKIFGFSKKPVNRVAFLVYINQDQALEWKGLASLNAKVIGRLVGFNYGDKWDNAQLKTYEVSTLKQGFELLKFKRIQGFVGYEIPWDYYLKQGEKTGQFKKLPAFDESLEFIAMSINHPRKQEILDAYDQGNAALDKSGELEKIKGNWR